MRADLKKLGSELYIKENDGINDPQRRRKGQDKNTPRRYEFDQMWDRLTDGANFTWENELGIVPLSADIMGNIIGQKREGNQNAIMNNLSATEVRLLAILVHSLSLACLSYLHLKARVRLHKLRLQKYR